MQKPNLNLLEEILDPQDVYSASCLSISERPDIQNWAQLSSFLILQALDSPETISTDVQDILPHLLPRILTHPITDIDQWNYLLICILICRIYSNEKIADIEMCGFLCSIYVQTFENIKFPNNKLLRLIHRILKDAFPSIKTLKKIAREANQLPETASSGKSEPMIHFLEFKFTPKDIQNLLSLLMVRYPSYVLPTVSEICKRDVFLSSPVLLQSTKKQIAFPVTSVQPFMSEEEEHPPFIRDMLKLIQEHLYIPLENVQLEAVINDRHLTTEVYHPLLHQAERLYICLGPKLYQIVTAMSKHLYHMHLTAPIETSAVYHSTRRASNASTTGRLSVNGPPHRKGSNASSLSDEGSVKAYTYYALVKKRNHLLKARLISSILIQLLRIFKYYHYLAFEHLSKLLLDNNFPVILLRIMSNWFPNPMVTTVKSTVDPVFRMAEYPPELYIKAVRHRTEPLEMDMKVIHSGPNSFPNSSSASTYSLHAPSSSVSEWYILATADFAHLLQKLSSNRPLAIQQLVQWKSAALLKRIYLAIESIHMLKLLKSQMPLLGRKWRTLNTPIISKIYMLLKPRLYEDYLMDMEEEKDIGELESLVLYWRRKVHGF